MKRVAELLEDQLWRSCDEVLKGLSPDDQKKLLDGVGVVSEKYDIPVTTGPADDIIINDTRPSEELISFDDIRANIPDNHRAHLMQFFDKGLHDLENLLLKATGKTSAYGLAETSMSRDELIGALEAADRKGLTPKEWKVVGETKGTNNRWSRPRPGGGGFDWRYASDDSHKRMVRQTYSDEWILKGQASYGDTSNLAGLADECASKDLPANAFGVPAMQDIQISQVEIAERTTKNWPSYKDMEDYEGPAWLVKPFDLERANLPGNLGTVRAVIVGPGCRQGLGKEWGFHIVQNWAEESRKLPKDYQFFGGHILNADFGAAGTANNIAALTAAANSQHKIWEKAVKNFCSEVLRPFYRILEQNYSVSTRSLQFGLLASVKVIPVSWAQQVGCQEPGWDRVSVGLICQTVIVNKPDIQSLRPFYRYKDEPPDDYDPVERVEDRLRRHLDEAESKKPADGLVENLPQDPKTTWAFRVGELDASRDRMARERETLLKEYASTIEQCDKRIKEYENYVSNPAAYEDERKPKQPTERLIGARKRLDQEWDACLQRWDDEVAKVNARAGADESALVTELSKVNTQFKNELGGLLFGVTTQL